MDGFPYNVTLWDTAGQEKYRAIAESYYWHAHGAIVVFDLTNQKSYKDLLDWQDELKKTNNAQLNVLIMGNKVDLESDRKITTEEAQGFCQEWSYSYQEVSAKTDQNVKKGFEDFFDSILEKQFDSL